MKRAFLCLLLILVLLAVLPPTVSSPAIAVPSGTTFVAKVGDSLSPPFPAGSAVDQLSPPDVNDAGQTSLYVRSNVGPCGVVIGDGSTPLVPYAVDGATSPDGPLAFCGQIGARPLTNASGAIAYAANVGSMGGSKGIYRSAGPGLVTKIVKQGDASLPPNPPGNFGVPELLDFNNSGAVLFKAQVGAVTALFSGNGTSITTLAKVGDALPSRVGGGSLASLGGAVMDNAGKVALKATVAGGSISEAIFLRATNGALTRVVAGNDIWFSALALAIPGAEEAAGAECNNALDDDGDTRINDGCAALGDPEKSCRNPIDNDADTKVNDGCPTLSEVRFLSVDEPAMNDAGVVAFRATLPSPYTWGYFLAETNSLYEDGNASCYDGIDNGGDTLVDAADNLDCGLSTNPHEDGNASCADGIDNGNDNAKDNADSDCLGLAQAVLPENPSIVGPSFGSPCGYDLAGVGPHLLGSGAAGFGGTFVKVGCGGDPVEAVMVFPTYDAIVIDDQSAPGGAGTWTGFSDPAISESGRIAFKGTTTTVSDSVAQAQEVCPDGDGDGLCDDWEQNGINSDNKGGVDLNLPAMGADKDKKDIFIEVDYMDCAQGGCDSEDLAGLGTCGDGIDNGGDGKIDAADPECLPLTLADYHNHKPIQAAINNMVSAFANSTAYNPTDAEGAGVCNDGLDNDGDTKKDAEDSECTGINLHVTVDEAIAHYQYLDFPPSGNVANPQPCVHGVGGTNFGGVVPYSFNAVKSSKFGTAVERGGGNWKAIKAAKQKVFHYTLFTHQQAPNNTSSGCAEVHGNDLYVSLGAWSHEDGVPPFSPLGQPTCSDGQDNGLDGKTDSADFDCIGDPNSLIGVTYGNQAEHEGTFMHEFGHNLALKHGGNDDFNYNPNYLSVMSYTFQMPYIVANRPLDYSRWVLPAPVEDRSGVLGSCADGVDNGADTVKDAADPDCQRPPASQSEGLWTANCADGYDNDNDGQVDINDPDCNIAAGIVEGKPAQYCSDVYDNDNDTLVDPEDPDCSVGQVNEYSLIEDEGIDDGAPPPGLAALQTAFTEFPNEYGVDGPDAGNAPDDLNGDTRIEKADNEKGAGSCYDAIDNDGDGNADLADIDCLAAAVGLPLIGEGRDTCSNLQDDDGDTLGDGLDPDCQCRFRVVPATGSIDWNINRSIEGAGAPLNVDVPMKDPEEDGNYRCWTAVPFQTPAGWDDWHNLNLNFRQSQGNYADGLPNAPVPEQQERPPVPLTYTGPVGGVAALPAVAESGDSGGWLYAALAGGLAAVILTIAAGAWYARRRFSLG